MNIAEAHELLMFCQGFDNRRSIDDYVVAAWAGALADISIADARQATLDYYRRTRDFITVSDVIAGACAIAKARTAAASPHAPGCRNIVTEFGSDAATRVRELTGGGQWVDNVEPIGKAAVRRLLDQLAARFAMPDVGEDMTEAERSRQRAIMRARQDRREQRSA